MLRAAAALNAALKAPPPHRAALTLRQRSHRAYLAILCSSAASVLLECRIINGCTITLPRDTIQSVAAAAARSLEACAATVAGL
jgi:hypothetical protein